MIVEPVTLQGSIVRLEPMTADHIDALTLVGLEPALWRWTQASITSRDDMRAYVFRALDELRHGLALPFVIVAHASGRVIGSTRYGSIDTTNRRLEIGWTWITSAYQRTAVNTEAKLLLLTHAFERLEAQRVELKTDVLNQQSREAIARLGAVQEGIFRKHIITASGRVRDTVYYSILDTEWPLVKAGLERKLGRAAASPDGGSGERI